jgi:hypothetical protein
VLVVAGRPEREAGAVRRRTVVLTLAATGLALGPGVGPAAAGGGLLYPVHDRYEPGDTATLVGYTGGGQLGWVEDGPFHAWLAPTALDGGPAADGPHRPHLPAGPLVTEETGRAGAFRLRVADGPHRPHLPAGPLVTEETGRAGAFRLRLSVTVPLPADLAPGRWSLEYCNDPCTTGLGDLVGGFLFVGADPPFPIARQWPLDDPAVADLGDHAVLSGPGYRTTAAEARAGLVTAWPPPPPAVAWAGPREARAPVPDPPAAAALPAGTASQPAPDPGLPAPPPAGAAPWWPWVAVTVAAAGLWAWTLHPAPRRVPGPTRRHREAALSRR